MNASFKFCHSWKSLVPACRQWGFGVANPWRRVFGPGAVFLFVVGVMANALGAADAPKIFSGATIATSAVSTAGAAGEQSGVVIELPASVLVDGTGVFLHQLLGASAPVGLAQIRVAASPSPVQMLNYSRAQVADLVARHAPELGACAWSGATQVRVTRRMRALEDTELKQHLTDVLQREQVKERGELELRLVRPWTPVNIPDEPFTVRIIDLPTAGISASFIVRFEMRTATEVVGSWQLFLQAKILRDVFVARAAIKRGTKLREADLAMESRDVLALREVFSATTTQDDTLELAEYVPAGQPLSARAVRVRPVVLRGSVADALVQDGTLSVSIKVEVLEDGVPGQTIRIRNLQTKREFHGKVHNEQTILVSL